MKEILPSLLAANFATLQNTLPVLEKNGFNTLHLDVMDGHFVPPITFGSQMVANLKNVTKARLDVHLMTYRLEEHIPAMLKAGANFISFHFEAAVHTHRLIMQIKEGGCKAGVAIVPSTPVSALTTILPFVDFVLVMSVNPGYGGQQFIEQSYGKIEYLNHLRKNFGYKYLIEMDGGINQNNATVLFKKGVDLLVVGSALINSQLEENCKIFHSLTLGV